MSPQKAGPAKRGAVRAGEPLSVRVAGIERALAGSRKQPKTTTNDSEHLLKLLPDAVLVHCDGKVVFANDAAARMLGATKPKDLIGRDTLAFIHPDYLDVVKQRVRRMVGKNLPTEMVREKRVRLDGKSVSVESLAIPCEWHGRRGILAVNRDLTEKKRAKIALRESEERYRRLVELLPDAVFIHCDDKIVYTNAAAVRVFGAEHPEQILGRNYLDFCHPEDRALVRARVNELAIYGESSEFAARRRLRLDGSEFPAETAVQLLFWKDKPATLVVVRDLTEPKRAQEAIEAKSALLEATVNALNEGLWAFDHDLRMLAWNERAMEILGFPAEMFYPGAPFQDFIRYASTRGDYGPGNVDDHVASRIAIARSSKFESFERKAANGRTIETRVHPMKDGGMVATFLDITERKIAEQARETLTRQLAGQASELKRSNEELEQFAYIASHDLQEPLRMVSSYCQLLERRYKDKLDGDASEFIRFAVDGATRMQTLINDLLAFSRVGRHGKALQPISLQAALDMACANLKRVIGETNVEIGADPLPTVMGDDTQLAQLFQNLIENAIKFRREDPARVRVSTKETPAGYEVAVQDNGIGMEPQYAERIFLMFQRLHDRTKYAGNGIGLAICKKIVERHDGRIWVESEPGKGSTFKFTLMRG